MKRYYTRPQDPLAMVAFPIAVVIGIVTPLIVAGDRALVILPALLIGASAGLVFGIIIYLILKPSVAIGLLVVGGILGIALWNSLGGIWRVADQPWFIFGMAGAIAGAHLRYLLEQWQAKDNHGRR